MHDLRLVGVHDDGDHLLLVGGDGARYRLRIDDAVRAAVRRDRARMGQLQIEMDGGLRPRDIQARIRAGETAQDVAAAAGLPLEHVRRYEGPVLAEREHVCDLARRLGVHRGDQRTAFGELVVTRLTGRGVDTEDVSWDSWRHEGSTWTVQVSFRAGSKDRRALWRYDLLRSHLEPQDDEARWLCAVEEADSGPLSSSRKLSAVRERVYDVEADGGVRAAGGTADDGSLEEAGDHESSGTPEDTGEQARHSERRRTLDLLDTLRERRGRRQPLDLPDDRADIDDAAGDTSEPPAAHPPVSRPEDATDDELLQLPAAAGSSAEDDETHPDPSGPADHEVTEHEVAVGAGAGHGAESVTEPAPRPAPRPARTRSRGGSKRASVPSWDEIMFGAKRE